MKITIFTPTYNRAYILNRTYESIISQKTDNLEWVIIDDGSIDNTEALVSEWIDENQIRIKYMRQENQGRYAAFNNGKQLFEGELIIFLDSDDYLLPGAISKIETVMELKEYESCSGIIAYLEGKDKKIIGSTFPKDVEREKIYVLYDKYHMTGDKFISLKNEYIQRYNYPYYKGEKFTGDSIVFNKINDEKPMLLVRESFEHREYINDGLTNNRNSYHFSAPNGMADHYYDAIEHEHVNKVNRLKHTLGYIAYAKFSGRPTSEVVRCLKLQKISLLLYPLGLGYFYFLKRQSKKSK